MNFILFRALILPNKSLMLFFIPVFKANCQSIRPYKHNLLQLTCYMTWADSYPLKVTLILIIASYAMAMSVKIKLSQSLIWLLCYLYDLKYLTMAQAIDWFNDLYTLQGLGLEWMLSWVGGSTNQKIKIIFQVLPNEFDISSRCVELFKGKIDTFRVKCLLNVYWNIQWCSADDVFVDVEICVIDWSSFGRSIIMMFWYYCRWSK